MRRAGGKLVCATAIAASTFALACTAQVGDESDDSSDRLILNGEDWLPLSNHELSATREHRIISIYGRAVGRSRHYKSNGTSASCSGALIADDVFVTAAHCRTDLENKPETIGVEFGRFAPPLGIPGEYGYANSQAWQRLGELGIPRSSFPSIQSLRSWTCDHDQRDSGGRDIDFYRCRSKTLTMTLGGESRVVILTPGMIWGHAPASRDRSVGTCGSAFCRYNANVVSINRRCGVASRDALFSVGNVRNPDPGTCSHCFYHDSDTVAGSSGGPVFNGQGRMWAVHSGYFGGLGGSPDSACSSYSTPWSYNRGFYFSSRLDDYVLGDHGGASVSGIREWTDYAGTPNGTGHFMRCPTGMAVSGVIGTTADSGHVGSLGLVCSPNRTDSIHRIDRSVVVAGVSHDTGFEFVEKEDLTVVLAEKPSSSRRQRAARAIGMRSLYMCAPHEFMSALTVRAAQVVNRVEGITCFDPENETSRELRNPEIGDDPGGWVKRLECPSKRWAAWKDRRQTVVAGMRIHSSWGTDGLELRCAFDRY